jgi:hypothetical protein
MVSKLLIVCIQKYYFYRNVFVTIRYSNFFTEKATDLLTLNYSVR